MIEIKSTLKVFSFVLLALAGVVAQAAPDLASDDRGGIRRKIVAEREKCVWRGQTRHCPEYWRKMNTWVGGIRDYYMNGGYWAVGTAYSLAALYDADPAGTVALLKDLLSALEKSDFAEWEHRDGAHFGARKFMMSAALPLAAVEAILANKPLLDWF